MYRRLPTGEKNRWVTIKRHKIETSSTAVDTYGQVSVSTTAYTNSFGCWAKIEQLSGEELELAKQMYPKASYRFTIDYASTMDSTGGSRRSVDYNNRLYHIGAVINPDMENIDLQLICGTER